MGFRSRRFRPRHRMNFGRVRRIVRSASGITLVKRVLLDDLTVPAITSAAYDNPLIIDLVECTEAMDEEVESDGSAIADVPLYSRISAMKLRIMLQTAAAPGAIRARWALVKKPDGESLVTSLVEGLFHSSNDTPTGREVRKYMLAKGIVGLSNNNLVTPVKVFVSRQAWKRASPMRENDKIAFIIAQSSNATIKLSGFGNLYCKANG